MMEVELWRGMAPILIFALMSVWEWARPKRPLALGRLRRWPVNLGLALGNQLLQRVSVGAAAYQAALWADSVQLGLLHWVSTPHWLAVALTLLVLDVAIYAQHLAAHRWDWFWRLHQVHHTDLDFDSSTALRFHPLEIAVSLLYKMLCIAALGADPLAVVAFEIILNGCALFNHGNVAMPSAVERRLRWLLVTPDMHRIHHSALRSETDSNYGFSLSCWDRWFRTYTGTAHQDQTTMPIGLPAFRDGRELDFWRLLWLPFMALRRG